ncbi:hypothetical protein D9M68_802320 [compost metagenome]
MQAAADDLAVARRVFAGHPEAGAAAWACLGEVAVGEAGQHRGLGVLRHQLEDHIALAGELAVGYQLARYLAVAWAGQGALHLLAEQLFDIRRRQLLVGEMALEHLQHGGGEGGDGGAFLDHGVRADQALHHAFAWHGHLHARYVDQARLGVGHEIYAVDRFEDKAERGQADQEYRQAEGHGLEAAEHAHTGAACAALARFGEVFPLQGAQ